MRTFTFLFTSILVAAALAGCTGGDDGDETPTPTPMTVETTPTPAVTPTPTAVVTPTPTTAPPLDSSTYTLDTHGMPGQVKPSTKFNFTLYVNGSVARASDHIGAHFANNDTTNPPGTGRRDCEHYAGDLPGMYVVNCTISDIGTWYVWGHARINDSGELRNWWVPTPEIVSVRDYNITLSNVPTSIQTSNSTWNVTLNITGIGSSPNATSNHLGVHFWNATQPSPSADNAEGSCQHIEAAAIGTHTIQCQIANSGVAPKEYFIRGHLRLVEGGTQLSWWSQEYKVTIGPHLGLPI